MLILNALNAYECIPKEIIQIVNPEIFKYYFQQLHDTLSSFQTNNNLLDSKSTDSNEFMTQ